MSKLHQLKLVELSNTLEHLSFFQRVYSDKSVLKFIPDLELPPETLFNLIISSNNKNYFIIEQDGLSKGIIGFHWDTNLVEVEMGIILLPKVKKGLAAEAIRALFKNILRQSSCKIVNISIEQSNTAAIRCAKQLKFEMLQPNSKKEVKGRFELQNLEI